MALDDSKSERLWRQIEARKQAEDPGPVPYDPARNGNAPGEVAFVDALFKTLQEESTLPSPQDQEAARARLRQAISSERQPVAQTVPVRTSERPRRFEWNRQSLLIALLLFLLVVGASFAAWNAWQRMCHSTQEHKSTKTTPPAILIHNARDGANLRSTFTVKATDEKTTASVADGRTQVHCE